MSMQPFTVYPQLNRTDQRSSPAEIDSAPVGPSVVECNVVEYQINRITMQIDWGSIGMAGRDEMTISIILIPSVQVVSIGHRVVSGVHSVDGIARYVTAVVPEN